VDEKQQRSPERHLSRFLADRAGENEIDQHPRPEMKQQITQVISSGIRPIQGTIKQECRVQDGTNHVIKVADKRADIGEMRIVKDGGEIVELETPGPRIRICQNSQENKPGKSGILTREGRPHG
jgi:hypothetical protein